MSVAGWVWVRPLGVVSKRRTGEGEKEEKEGRGAGGVRVVDENVELAAGQLGDFLAADPDAVRLGDVEREAGHAHVGHLSEHGRVAGRGEDMDAWQMSD